MIQLTYFPASFSAGGMQTVKVRLRHTYRTRLRTPVRAVSYTYWGHENCHRSIDINLNVCNYSNCLRLPQHHIF